MLNKSWVNVTSGITEEDLVSLEAIDKLLDLHERYIKSNTEEIELSKQSITYLTHKKEQLQYGSNSVIFDVADILHSSCNLIHDNSEVRTWDLSRLCVYYEGNWGDFSKNPPRLTYYNKAKNIVQKSKVLNISISNVMKLLSEDNA